MRSFFKVPLKIHHGLLLVTQLAVLYDDGLSATLQDVAGSAGISQGFLEQVARPLRRAGIIIGRRGSGGGYRLAVEPAKLTVADVLTAIEGPVDVIDCLSNETSCILADNCANRDVWMKIRIQIMNTLKNMTIAEAAGLGRPGHSRHESQKKRKI